MIESRENRWGSIPCLVLVYNIAVVLLVPARMQFVLFHPLANVDVSEADCVDDLLTSGGLSCSRGPSY